MTIANQTARTGPYNGNGSTTVFAYDFRILDQSHVVVTLKSAANVETVQTLTTNYTVSGVGGSTGGNITMGVAPASGEQLTFSRNIPQTQEVDLANRGGVQPEVLESAYDKLTQLSQDKAELINRVPRFPVSSTLTNVEFPLTLTANTALIVNAGGTGYTNGPTSSQISGAAAEAAAAASSATDSANSATASAASAATAANYTGTQSVDLFNGTGSQTAFTLSVAPANGDENNTDVHISGVYQQKNTYAVSGTTLTFSTAPPAATGNVEVMHMSARAIETPADGSVTYPKFASGLVDIDLSSVSGSDDTIASAKAIKTYVDAQVDTVDTLAEVLAIGNTSAGTDLAISAGDDITFTDSSKAIFGAGGDLEIYHNGSNTYINETGTGKLIILATDLTMADTGNAHNYLNAVSGAGVTLYYDNNSRIATTATGVTITGEAIATGFTGTLDGILGSGSASAATVTALEVTSLSGTGAVTITDILDEDNMASNSATKLSTQQSIKAYVDAQVDTVDTLAETLAIGNTSAGTDLAISAGDDITFTDSSKALFGAGSDLQIYHDGSNSYVTDAGTGDLMLRGSNDIFLSNVAGNSIYGRFAEGGAVSLYHNGSVKFVTAATGVTITGEATATGFTGTLDGVLGGGTPAAATVTTTQINGTATVGVDDTGYDVKFFGATSGSYMLWDESANNLVLAGGSTLVFGGDGLIDTTSGPLYIRTQSGSTIRIGDNTDANVQIGSGGGDTLMYNNVGIGTTAPATTLHVVGDATITDDLKLLSDSAILSFGADSEVTLTHVHDVGLAQPAGQTIYRGAAGDFDAAFTSRNNTHGQSDFEWGHSSGGYGNTLGSHVSSGVGFICFHGGRGSGSNTYQTHGQAGCGFQDNNNRILTFFSLDTADADNQSPTTRITLNGTNGNLVVSGALSKGSGSFRINHPLESKEDTHDLVHSFIEGPQADLIYRGRVTLSGGSATVNIDTSAGMTAGTFDVLCRDVQCFTSNESGWTCVRGSVSGATLTIEAEAPDCTDTISWMVVGERKDHHMIDTDWTDENGKVIVEPEKVDEEIVNIGE